MRFASSAASDGGETFLAKRDATRTAIDCDEDERDRDEKQRQPQGKLLVDGDRSGREEEAEGVEDEHGGRDDEAERDAERNRLALPFDLRQLDVQPHERRQPRLHLLGLSDDA